MQSASKTCKNIFKAGTTNPKISNSFEKYLSQSKLEQPCMFIRQATPTIVMGINQNPWLECNVTRVKKDNINIMRRHTGGGTVYLDSGSLLVGFINKNSGSQETTSKINNQIIINAIESTYKLKSYSSGRNDIVVVHNGETKKVAGSAFNVLTYGKQNSQARMCGNDIYHMHHLSILVDCDLNKLSYYLTPSKKKLESKGIKSVQSRVANLNSYIPSSFRCGRMEEFKENLINMFAGGKEYKLINVTEVDMLAIPDVAKEYQTINKEEYIYGTHPDFTHNIENKFDFGLVNVCLKVVGGKITNANVYTDSLHTEFANITDNILINCRYDKKNILSNLQKYLSNNNDKEIHIINELVNYVANQID